MNASLCHSIHNNEMKPQCDLKNNECGLRVTGWGFVVFLSISKSQL